MSVLNLINPCNHIKDLWCISYASQRRCLSNHSFIMVIPPSEAQACNIHYTYSGFRVLHSGSEIFLPTTGKDATLRYHHCRLEKYTNFSKFALEKWFFSLFKIFIHLFLNKVLTTCLYPPRERGSPLQNCLWFKRASHSTYVITEKAREDCIAAPLSQAGRILPISLTNFGIN